MFENRPRRTRRHIAAAILVSYIVLIVACDLWESLVPGGLATVLIVAIMLPLVLVTLLRTKYTVLYLRQFHEPTRTTIFRHVIDAGLHRHCRVITMHDGCFSPSAVPNVRYRIVLCTVVSTGAIFLFIHGERTALQSVASEIDSFTNSSMSGGSHTPPPARELSLTSSPQPHPSNLAPPPATQPSQTPARRLKELLDKRFSAIKRGQDLSPEAWNLVGVLGVSFIGGLLLIAGTIVASVLLWIVLALVLLYAFHLWALRFERSAEISNRQELGEFLSYVALLSSWHMRLGWLAPKAIVVASSSEFWQEAIVALQDCVAAVIVDATELTPGVRWELGQLSGRPAIPTILLSFPKRPASDDRSAGPPEPTGIALPSHWTTIAVDNARPHWRKDMLMRLSLALNDHALSRSAIRSQVRALVKRAESPVSIIRMTILFLGYGLVLTTATALVAGALYLSFRTLL